jgi:hypothetical protein
VRAAVTTALQARPRRATTVHRKRYFTLDGTDHNGPREQAGTIRRYVAWWNRHATDPRVHKIFERAEIM